MKKYLVTYYETYKKSYEIQAVDTEMAREEFEFQMENGWLDSPGDCVDSGIEYVEEMEDETESEDE